MCSTTASCSGSGHIRQRSSGQRAARDSRRPAAAGARRRDPVAHDVASTRACLRATPARRRAILLRPRREAEVSSCGTARHSVPAGELCRPETCARLVASPTSTNSRRSSRSGRDGHLQRGRRPLRPGKLVDHRIAKRPERPRSALATPFRCPLQSRPAQSVGSRSRCYLLRSWLDPPACRRPQRRVRRVRHLRVL
jgi:hypothetical protein